MPIPRVEEFLGDGSTKTFPLKGPIYNRTDLVWVNGQFQNRSGYSIASDAKSFTLDEVPLSNDPVTISYSEADS